MPTEVVRYVNAGSTAGGTGKSNALAGVDRAYATMAEWESAEDANLVIADQRHHVYITGSLGTLALVGWTTDATHFIEIEAAPGQRAAMPWDAAKATLSTAAAENLIVCLTNNVRFTGLQFRTTNVGATALVNMDGREANDLDIRLDGCIFRGGGGASTQILVYLHNDAAGCTGGTVKISNCLFYDSRGVGLVSISANCLADLIRLRNCTMHQVAGRAILVDGAYAGAESVKNCLIQSPDAMSGATDDDAFNDYNAISENLAEVGIGSHGRYNQTFTFKDSANGDFRLELADVGARGGGIGRFVDAEVPVGDLKGTLRGGTLCDIGADESMPRIPRGSRED